MCEGVPPFSNGEQHHLNGIPLSIANVQAIVSEYISRYKRHVCREEYHDASAWERNKHATQEAWPEYTECLELEQTRLCVRW